MATRETGEGESETDDSCMGPLGQPGQARNKPETTTSQGPCSLGGGRQTMSEMTLVLLHNAQARHRTPETTPENNPRHPENPAASKESK